ncbi:S-adenosyl-L-methionine-dependent methyltransferase [Glomus cerebriforme]|uniref:S-adenosyl-L-methionine-dependent methyltransferase n=1 Tax=Glomus cerebriforme TaxID=658196 RepID=A0A397TF68_9GLOM|nr:S-adenosyl-L-methionine-dependent methyltransferase [Glomus cerebriforme]
MSKHDTLISTEFSKEINDFFLNYYTINQWEDICSSLSIPPCMTYIRINSRDENDIDKIYNILQEIINEQCRNKGWDEIKIIKHEILSDVLCIPIYGPFNDIIPYDKEIIVDKYAGTSILRGADIFAPGVLASRPVEAGENVAVMVDIDGNCHRGYLKNFTGKKLFIGNGKMLMSRHEIFSSNPSELSGIGVLMTQPLYRTPSISTSLSSHLSPLIFLQNKPSILVGHLLNPQPEDIILDMCASPGGKTTHIASLLQRNSRIDKFIDGIVIATDRSKQKIDKINQNAVKCGVKHLVKSFILDATKAILSNNDVINFKDLKCGDQIKGFPKESFDRILLDPPCSNLGQRPNFSVNAKLSDITITIPDYQRKLFTSAYKLLKPNGILVYSTCTFNPAENEQIISWALKNFPDLSLIEPEIKLGDPGLKDAGLNESQRFMVQRFDPGIKSGYDTIGFFIAKLKK